jgi:hypothetical protein
MSTESIVSRLSLLLAATACWVGCGARTGLGEPPTREDAATDANTDAPADTGADTFVPPDTFVPDVPTTPDSGPDTIEPIDTGIDVPPDVPPPDPLSVLPPNDLLILDIGKTPVAPQVVGYTALDTVTGADVTTASTFSVDDGRVGGFAAATFSSVTTLPATIMVTTVRAVDGARTGSTSLTVAQERRSPDPLGRHDFLYTSPFGGPASTADDDTLVFSAKVGQMDVAFLQDTTGSMTGELDNLKSALSSTIIPGLAGRIKSLGLGIAAHDDFPVDPYGSPGLDVPVNVLQTISTDSSLSISAVNLLTIHGGGDIPEAQIPAQYHLLTGAGLTWPGGSIPPHLPGSTDTWFGAMQFRRGGTPVIVEITDASWHDTTNTPYSFMAPTMTDLITAYNAVGGKFVGILIDLGTGDSGWSQGNTLSDATNSNVPPSAFMGKCGTGMCCTGLDGAAKSPDGPGGTCRLNFAARSDGSGVGDGILNGLSAIVASGEGTYDARVLVSNDPANPPGVDATQFIQEVRAVEGGDPAHGCAANPGYKSSASLPFDDTFKGVPSGTTICWKIVPAVNNFVKPIDRPQVFAVHLRVAQEPGDVFFGDDRVVLFVVPKA